MEYQEFLQTKTITTPPMGIEPREPHESLFDFQRDIVKWSLRLGRSAIFADCGMGKTRMQLEWSRQIPGDVLILAPLAVAFQTVREGDALDLPVQYCRSQSECKDGINITNYEMLEHFDPDAFKGIVLDESSILKSFDGKTRNTIIESFSETPYRLACTATPSPNDFMELGNHAEFLGAMTRTEMLSMFFIHDGGETAKWRIKGHAQNEFWKWICSWAVMIRKPSDLGYEDGDFILPELRVNQMAVEAKNNGDFLFPLDAQTLQERIVARRDSLTERVGQCAELVHGSTETWLIWCNLNSESDALEKAIDGAVQVKGSDSREFKEKTLMNFVNGRLRVLISKPSIAGFGLNMQVCHNMVFVGLSDSFESYYQAVRRCWRFGQKQAVDVHIITSKTEGAVVKNIQRKEADAERMATSMVQHMSAINQENIKGLGRTVDHYFQDKSEGKNWVLYVGDCVEVIRTIADDSIDFSVFSPPFASLYTYSASMRDMGNVKNHHEFFDHFQFVIKELYRTIKPGRNLSFHCMNLPTSKTRDGVIGVTDFRGQLIEAFRREGFIYHSEVCIWKDPVTAMQRTKALGLLWKQLKKDSAMSRQGIADYLVTMRKPGDNPNPVRHTAEEFPVDQWQKWASPVWMDIDPGDTLQYRAARENNDERHIAPLQLEVIRRAILLWSNPGDLVLSPFAGIGSEGWVAIKNDRRFLGIELKRSYWNLGVSNLQAAEQEKEVSLFA
jgi:DNA modification methylase